MRRFIIETVLIFLTVVCFVSSVDDVIELEGIKLNTFPFKN